MAEKKTTEREREKKDQERREFESRKYSGRQLAASGYSRAARSLTERCGHQKNSFGTRNRWPLVAMCGPFWSSSVLVRVSFSSMSHTRAPPPFLPNSRPVRCLSGPHANHANRSHHPMPRREPLVTSTKGRQHHGISAPRFDRPQCCFHSIDHIGWTE